MLLLWLLPKTHPNRIFIPYVLQNGKIQLYELGKKYRSYYANFIPEEYYDKDVYVRSSDKSRCMMSAYTFLAGLYPPTERQMWHPDIPWQPIPVHSLPRELDNVSYSSFNPFITINVYNKMSRVNTNAINCITNFHIFVILWLLQIVAGTKQCKIWKEMYMELLEEKNADPKYTELFDYLSKHTNQSMRSILEVDYLYSALMAQQESNLKIPEWAKNIFPNKMRTPFMLSLALLSYNETLQRFKVGKDPNYTYMHICTMMVQVYSIYLMYNYYLILLLGYTVKTGSFYLLKYLFKSS